MDVLFQPGCFAATAAAAAVASGEKPSGAPGFMTPERMAMTSVGETVWYSTRPAKVPPSTRNGLTEA